MAPQEPVAVIARHRKHNRMSYLPVLIKRCIVLSAASATQSCLRGSGVYKLQTHNKMSHNAPPQRRGQRQGGSNAIVPLPPGMNPGECVSEPTAVHWGRAGKQPAPPCTYSPAVYAHDTPDLMVCSPLANAPDTSGAVIGKGGSNIKMLQQRSGARLNVAPGRVEIQGTSAAVEQARQLLQQQIQAFQATGA